MVTRELRAFGTVLLGEVGAEYRWWITAPFDIHQKDSVVRLIRTLCIIVADVNVCTMIRVTRTSLTTGTPGAVRETSEFVPPGGDTGDGFGDKVGGEC